MKRATLLTVLLFTSLLYAQQPAPDAAAANAAFTAQDWAKAATLYQHLTASQPNAPRNWYRLGVSLQHTGDHQKALDAFAQAKAKGTPLFIVGYNMAVSYAALGQRDRALDELAAAIKAGYAQPDQLSSDPAIDSIRGDARFAALLEQARHNQSPCTYSAESRQFDFWLGDWDVVRTSDGAAAGTSHIERAMSDCVIWENWSSLGSPYFGKSYNAYNSNLKRWEQFWVDNAGGLIHFYGGLKENVMDYFTDDVPQPDGTKLRRHLQFFNLGPDKVRQFSQGSKDGGATWAVEYDLTYNRKK